MNVKSSSDNFFSFVDKFTLKSMTLQTLEQMWTLFKTLLRSLLRLIGETRYYVWLWENMGKQESEAESKQKVPFTLI